MHTAKDTNRDPAADLATLGERFRHMRTTRKPGVTQADAAKAAGISRSVLGRLESVTPHPTSGELARPAITSILTLARYYQCTQEETNELLALAGHQVEETPPLPWTPAGDPADMSDAELWQLRGIVDGILAERSKQRDGG